MARLLLLYDAYATHTQTVIEHLRSFSRFSEMHVRYAHAVRHALPHGGLDAFDVVAVHYSARLSLPDYFSSRCAEALQRFGGAKILFIQDEYENTETARRWMDRLAFDLVFTCVPPESIGAVYPPQRFPKTKFVTTLTGFVPPSFEVDAPRRPIASRRTVIGYRGRELPFFYGKLAREKMVIGQQMKQVAAQRGLAVDIEWSDDARIYGEGWYEFLASCKATLGTESGANVFDEHGEIRRSIERAKAQNPSLSFDEAWERLVKPHEGKIVMNQISPKVFEAIALGTALVLYEGRYSDVVKPGEHYLPLKKDLSNVDEIVRALADDAGLQAMADRAWRDVIGSGRWSYRAAIADFDVRARELIAGRAPAAEPFEIVLGKQQEGAGRATPERTRSRARLGQMATSAPLLAEQVSLDLGRVPLWLRVARRMWGLTRLGWVLERIRGY